MHANRSSPPAVLGLLVLVLANAGCTSGMGSARLMDHETISIVIDNQASERMLVFLTRGQSIGEQLGRVKALERRVFRIPYAELDGISVELHSMLANAAGHPFAHYTTLPFQVDGAREVRWVIRNGQRLSAVVLR